MVNVFWHFGLKYVLNIIVKTVGVSLSFLA